MNRNIFATITLSVMLIMAESSAALDCVNNDCVPNHTSGGFLKNIQSTGYDYVPSIMWDGDRYKMWWCSGPLTGTAASYGDRIAYAESFDLVTWFNQQEVFHPTGHPDVANNCTTTSTFDCALTCDPSVVKVRGKYYMYYGGFPVPADPTLQNKTGVAVSDDGKTNWVRLNGGNPILVGKNPYPPPTSDNYGAGHPSVFYLGGYYYMSYTDTTVATGEYQYAIRSKDPAFTVNTEELTGPATWTPLTNATYPAPINPQRTYAYVQHTKNVDWAYIDSLDEIVVSGASHDDTLPPGARHTRHVHFLFFDSELASQTRPVTFLNGASSDPILPNPDPAAGTWLEGTGIARYGNGHALHDKECDKIHLHVIRPSDMENSYPGGPPGSHGGTHYNNCWTNQFVLPPYIVWRSCWELGRIHWDLPTPSTLNSCPATRIDYDDDSMSEPIIWRPSDRTFRVRRSSEGDLPIITTSGTTSNSKPATGDFDGDGRMDFVTATPDANNLLDWRIVCSSGSCGTCSAPASCSGNIYLYPNFGNTSSQIAIADYNGDGKDDIAYFRPCVSAGNPADCTSSNDWNIAFPNGTTMHYNWGNLASDIAAPGDYDGDGLADAAIYRVSQSKFLILKSSNPSQHIDVSAGGSNHIPIPGDWDNDGWDDYSTFRTTDRTFFLKANQGGATATRQWGQSGDLPLAADFNADGYLDIAIYRPSDRTWRIEFRRFSTAHGSQVIQWGQTNDVPIRLPVQ